MSKYHSKKTIVNGIEFASKREASRYEKLKEMQDNGLITDLRLQVPYILVPAFNLGKKRYRQMTYVADFVYNQDNIEVVEDCKGYRTEIYKIKKKLMAYIYQIEIKET